jgi:hypothetical protein
MVHRSIGAFRTHKLEPGDVPALPITVSPARLASWIADEPNRTAGPVYEDGFANLRATAFE